MSVKQGLLGSLGRNDGGASGLMTGHTTSPTHSSITLSFQKWLHVGVVGVCLRVCARAACRGAVPVRALQRAPQGSGGCLGRASSPSGFTHRVSHQGWVWSMHPIAHVMAGYGVYSLYLTSWLGMEYVPYISHCGWVWSTYPISHVMAGHGAYTQFLESWLCVEYISRISHRGWVWGIYPIAHIMAGYGVYSL